MVEVKSLPDTSDDIRAYLGMLDMNDVEEEVEEPWDRTDVVSDIVILSGTICIMFSSSLTTSSIAGLASGLSLQHLTANSMNLSTHSDG